MDQAQVRNENPMMGVRPVVLLGWAAVAAAFLWVYGPTLGRLAHIWWKEADYGHGFFVPVFAVVLLWSRRHMITPWPRRGSAWGLALLGVFGAFVLASTYFPFPTPVRASIIPFLAGAVLFVGGWRALHWSWPAIAFLVFMVPLPEGIASMLRDPLQRIGTISSVFIIQTLGIPATAQGNIIHLTEGPLGVEEACSGLRMLMLFFAVCIGAAFLLRQPWWEKVVVVLSSVPIAIAANVLRITVTALLHDLVSVELAHQVMHDFAGLMMMPVGIAMLSVELWLISHLVVEPPDARPLATVGGQGRSRGTGRASPAPAAASLVMGLSEMQGGARTNGKSGKETPQTSDASTAGKE
ncbi:MAG: exosortase/archaeosortase family protein [Thermoguttaceae bacterium]